MKKATKPSKQNRHPLPEREGEWWNVTTENGECPCVIAQVGPAEFMLICTDGNRLHRDTGLPLADLFNGLKRVKRMRGQGIVPKFVPFYKL